MPFGQKRMYPKNQSGRECCWPYLIGQHLLTPVFGQKRAGTPGNSYSAQLPPAFGHFFVPFLADLCSFLVGYSTARSNQHGWAPRTINSKFRPGDVEIDKQFWATFFLYSPVIPLRSFITPAKPQPTSKMSTERYIDCRRSRQLMEEQRAKNKPYSQCSHLNILITQEV